MPIELRKRLQEVVDREKSLLQAITDQQASVKLGDAWSNKEELGHLIDSATNNHVRFVRAALESPFRGPSYQQNGWVALHAYNDLPLATLIDFWHRYNSLLAHVIGQIPEERLATECFVGSGDPVTLGFLIDDYILHMQHHLDHVLRRAAITQYPGAAVGV
jgi:hypothetical protein